MEHQQSMQEQYLAVITQVIEDNMDNESFSVADLARKAGLSRSMLHRKLIRLTGKSATDLITEIRLKKAFELLEKDAGTVSEIAYMVGYSSPSYFNKVFKKTYKVSPGEVKRNGRGNIPHLRVVREPGVPDSARSKRSRLKVIAKPSLLILALAIVGALALILFNHYQHRLMSRDIRNLDKSIAVLPFENLSSDLTQQWFAEGISDLISSQLTKVSGYRVIGRTSTERFRDREMNIAEIGKALGVNFVVAGVAQKQEDQLRIVIHLILVKNETHLWSEVYAGSWNEIFDIQADIAKKVSSSLLIALSPEEDKKLTHSGTQDPEAWEYYLQGEVLMKKLTELNIWKAIDKYKQAIELDENFAQAYSAMAFAYFELTIWDVPDPDPAYIPISKSLALRALELNESLAEPHFILGALSYHHDWDWKTAEKSFEKGMELDSSYSRGHVYYANFLNFTMRYKEAVYIGESLIRRDPLNPFWYVDLAFPYFRLGEIDKAIELLNRCLELNPDNISPKLGLALTYLEQGTNLQYVYDYCEEQLGLFDQNLQKISSGHLGNIGLMLVKSGCEEEVHDILNELINRTASGTEDTPYFALGLIYSVLDEREKALDYLEKSVEERELFIITINMHTDLLPLRNNKRFQDLLFRLGFEV